MKRKVTELSQRYVAALRKHLKRGPKIGSGLARSVGRQAVASGLETLDMARIHEQALDTLKASASKDGLIKKAEIFFTESISPIEETHRAAVDANAHLNEVNQRLGRRTANLAATNRSLKQSAARRRTVEGALKKSGGHSKKLLAESYRLQKHLRHLARQVLAAQENNRRKISHDLKDEIAQTLLGINVRLLTVKKSAGRHDQGLRKEIENTQRLVHMSVKSIKRFAREYGKHNEP
jgi:signal transduction histidine kinase